MLSAPARGRLNTVFATNDVATFEAAGSLADQRTTVDAAGNRLPRGGSHCGRPTTGTARTEQTAGNEPDLAHRMSVVQRDRRPYRHRRDNSDRGSQQHLDQTHQKNGLGFTNARNYKTCILSRSTAGTAAGTFILVEYSQRIAKSPLPACQTKSVS